MQSNQGGSNLPPNARVVEVGSGAKRIRILCVSTYITHSGTCLPFMFCSPNSSVGSRTQKQGGSNLPPNARVVEVGSGPKRIRILCVTHVQGRLGLLCNLIRNVQPVCVINAGNFGFFGTFFKPLFSRCLISVCLCICRCMCLPICHSVCISVCGACGALTGPPRPAVQTHPQRAARVRHHRREVWLLRYVFKPLFSRSLSLCVCVPVCVCDCVHLSLCLSGALCVCMCAARVTHVQSRLGLLCNLIRNVRPVSVINARNYGFFGMGLNLWVV